MYEGIPPKSYPTLPISSSLIKRHISFSLITSYPPRHISIGIPIPPPPAPTSRRHSASLVRRQLYPSLGSCAAVAILFLPNEDHVVLVIFTSYTSVPIRCLLQSSRGQLPPLEVPNCPARCGLGLIRGDSGATGVGFWREVESAVVARMFCLTRLAWRAYGQGARFRLLPRYRR